MSTAVDEHDAGAVPGDPTGQADEQAQPALYPGLEAWVEGYFTPVFLRRIPENSRVRWCARWWDHAEAIMRLNLLWNGWETARWKPQHKAGWWLDLDHHLPILIGLDGPFRQCRAGGSDRSAKHHPVETPTVEPAPDGWWSA